ncbi:MULTISPECIES: transporter substrate-binding domain-containing protein [Trichocoleus]|uniref:Transporter substrate-binding domain-containing protein n=1 Tax=Trichocoleus desertorum GB2-A4 TaxID=2933944 RepID=A0ABV0J5C6_9CYAN|nr:transporter substrate-binding domain-containing protein [Trichocoleus sp. FACHB-46]
MLLTSAAHGCIQSPQSGSTLKASNALLTQIKQRGHLLVATEDDYPPFEFLVNEKPIGFDHELLAQLRKTVAFEIHQEILPWQGILPGVADGKYDLALTAVGITDDRAKTLDFTMPIAESTVAYIKRKDDLTIKTLADLSGKVLGVQQGGVSLAAIPDLAAQLKQQGGTLGQIKQYRGFAQAYQDLLNQQLDAVLHNIVSLSVLVSEKPAIFELGERVSRKSYAAWAVKKGNQDLLDLLNRFLGDLRTQGELKRLQEKWFKITFANLPTQPLLPGDRPLS